MTSHEPRTQPPASYAPPAVPEATIRLLLAALDHDASEASIATLHTAICERVRLMREAGDQPEVVLARMKRLTATALNDGTPPRAARTGDPAALVAQVGQWCIAEYFRKS